MRHTSSQKHIKNPYYPKPIDQAEMKRKAILIGLFVMVSFNIIVAKLVCS